MLSAEVITQLSPQDRLVEEWSELAASCRTATVFQTAEWLVTWWTTIGRARGRSLYIVTLRESSGESRGQLVGLFPLMLSGWHGVPIKRLSFMGVGVSDYGDAIALPGREEEVAVEGFKFLALRTDWSVLDLRELRNCALLRQFPPTTAIGLTYEDFPLEPCPYLELDQKVTPEMRWETLTKTYSKKMRGNIGYYDRTLRRTFQVDDIVVEREEELADAFENLFELHQRRWNRRWLPGVFTSTKVRAFHVAVGKKLLKRGWLRLHVLLLDEEVQAALYAFAFNDRTCYYQGGFEPEYARYSLGSILIANAIKISALEGFPTFDFLRGNEEYKQRWTNGNFRTNIRRLIAKRDSSALVTARNIHRLEFAVETKAKAIFADGVVRRPKRADTAENAD